MLGFYPIASAPIGAAEGETQVYLTSQTATLTLSSIELSAGVNRVVDAQSLITTLNSLTIQAAANYALNSQTLTATLHSPTISVTANVSVALTGQSITSAIHGTNSLGGNNCAIAALPICAIPYPDPALEFTGVQIDAYPAITGQTLSTTLNSVAVSDDDVIVVSPQVITTTLNSVVASTDALVPTLDSQTFTTAVNSIIVEVQPPTFDSQTLSSTLNSVDLVTDVVLDLSSQTLTLSVNSVAVGIGYTILVDSQSLSTTLNSVDITTGHTITVGSQTLQVYPNFVSLVTDQVLSVTGQTIYTTLNGLRLWQTIDTVQPSSCSGAEPGTWTEIAFGELFYGDNFAIAATPIGTVPQLNAPIRVTPPQAWDQINTTTTTTWNRVET